MDILNSGVDPAIITWLPHGCGFVILDKKRFSSEVLPKYLKGSPQYSSFTRRMNRWRFTIVLTHGQMKSSYFHPKFDRNDPDLCHGMVPAPQTNYMRRTKKEDSGHGQQATKHALQTIVPNANSDTAINKKSSSPPFMHDDAQKIHGLGLPIPGRHIPAISSDTASNGSTDSYPHVALRRDQQEQAFACPQIQMQNPSYSTNQVIQVDCNVSIKQLYAERQANHTQEMMMSNMVPPRLRTPNFAYPNTMPEYAGHGGDHYQHSMMPTSSPGQRPSSQHTFSQNEQTTIASMQNYYTQYYSASNGDFSGNNSMYPYHNQMYYSGYAPQGRNCNEAEHKHCDEP